MQDLFPWLRGSHMVWLLSLSPFPDCTSAPFHWPPLLSSSSPTHSQQRAFTFAIPSVWNAFPSDHYMESPRPPYLISVSFWRLPWSLFNVAPPLLHNLVIIWNYFIHLLFIVSSIKLGKHGNRGHSIHLMYSIHLTYAYSSINICGKDE